MPHLHMHVPYQVFQCEKEGKQERIHSSGAVHNKQQLQQLHLMSLCNCLTLPCLSAAAVYAVLNQASQVTG